MSASLTLWIVIVAVGGLTYLCRLSFIAVFARWDMPPLMVRALRYVPAAMLTTIIVPALVLRGGTGEDPAQSAAKLIAACAAAAVAWRTRSTTATMAVGMITLWAIQWIMRGAI